MVHNRIRSESAVSPVVGVMLMLVVVIIIAALVSAFGGSLMQTGKTAPQASITGEYSQSAGLSMFHNGGEGLTTKDLQIIIRLGSEFGSDQTETTAKIVNLSTVQTRNGIYWKDAATGIMKEPSWLPGEYVYVTGEDLANSGITTDYPPCYRPISSMPGGGSTCYADSINNQINVGKTITLEVMELNGKLISSSKVFIEP